MQHILIIARESEAIAALRAGLVKYEFACSICSFDEKLSESIIRQAPNLLLVEADTRDSETWELIRRLKLERSLPVIALITGEIADDSDNFLQADDFLTGPYDVKELIVRTRRLLHSSRNTDSGEFIKCDHLVIDLTNCDVTVSGRVVELTFKEYELLKLLAANRGRVFTREDLLDKIWGYEYYGGDRTVDVHIRRLRSKIEGQNDTFIETVRNIGYRFKKDS